MGSLVLTGDTSGSVTLDVPLVAGSNTATIAAATGTHFPFTAGTLVNSTSGTSIDFTSIPSWVKRITVMFNGVSTSGTSGWLIQIGGASFETSGYVSAVTYTGTGSGGSSSTAGFIIVPASAGTASNICTGIVTLGLLDSSTNAWVHQTVAGLTQSGTVYSVQGGGSKAITGSLARVRITTINGTDTFDAGSVNILFE
jgi:hypothetical protein